MFKSFIVLILSAACVGGPVTIKIHPVVITTVQLEEPSDIHFYEGHYYMVSDKGFLYETDAKGIILKKSSFIGSDFEGVYRKGDKVYVTAERLRQVHVFNAADLVWEKTYTIPFEGKKNSGFEGICYNETKNSWLIANEKNDPILIELNDSFQIQNQILIADISDISSVTFNAGYIYLLGDEDQQFWELDAKTYQLKRKFKFNIINPEGITFDEKGRIYIVSDELQQVFQFNTIH